MLEGLLGSQYTLSVEMLLNLVSRIRSERKFKKNLDIQIWVLSRSSRRHPENVLGTSPISLPGTSLECQIKTSPGCHFRTSPGRQIGTSPRCHIVPSPERSNRIFRGRPGDVGGGRPRDVLGTNICRLGMQVPSILYIYGADGWWDLRSSTASSHYLFRLFFA